MFSSVRNKQVLNRNRTNTLFHFLRSRLGIWYSLTKCAAVPLLAGIQENKREGKENNGRKGRRIAEDGEEEDFCVDCSCLELSLGGIFGGRHL